jgi:hypothetical protein
MIALVAVGIGAAIALGLLIASTILPATPAAQPDNNSVAVSLDTPANASEPAPSPTPAPVAPEPAIPVAPPKAPSVAPRLRGDHAPAPRPEPRETPADGVTVTTINSW